MNKIVTTAAIAGTLAVSGTALYAWAGERPQMRLQRYRLRLPSAAGLRLLHLSDQHFAGDNWIRRKRLDALRHQLPGLQPDLIVFSGDFLHDDHGLDAVEELLRILPPAPLGMYAVLGNHDYVEYSYGEFFRRAWVAIQKARTPGQKARNAITELKSLAHLLVQIYYNDRLRFAAVPNNTTELRQLLDLYEVRVLTNDAVPLPEHARLWLAGVDDLVEGKPDLPGVLASVPDDAAIVLLAHNPDHAYAHDDRRVVLTLSGHTHGGQVILPGVGAVHTQGTCLPRHQPAGIFTDLPSQGTLVVSRGMGESTPLRMGCPPEVVLIDLIP